jgi:ribosomal protein S27E
MTGKPKVACPNCGNTNGIYARADIRWQDVTHSWEICEIVAPLDCNECEHEWELPKDWPTPAG